MLRRTLMGMLVVLLPCSALGSDLPSIAVMDIKGGTGVSDELITVVTSSVARTAAQTEAFSVISGDDIQALLSLEVEKQLCGVESDSCLAEIGGALGADYLISGSVNRLGGKLVVDLALLDVRDARSVNKVNRQIGGEASLLDAVPEATVELLAKALEGRQGTLVVSVSEAGASIKIDGRIVGVSPLGPKALTAGTHLLEVEKTGFITAKEQVTVVADQTAARSVALLPSPDFLEKYESRAGKMRLGGWLSAGVAAAGLGAGVGLGLWADRLAADFQESRDCYTGVGAAGCLRPERQELVDASTKGKGVQTGSFIGYGAAAAGGVAAAYFFVAGEDPGRYRQFRVAAAPGPDGFWAGLTLDF